MSLLLMRGGVGLPRNGLIALYDPYRDVYGRNVLPVGAEDFATGWQALGSATITVTPNQPDPDGGNNAYRIQTSGGSLLQKYQAGITHVVGVYHVIALQIKVNAGSCVLKNMGSDGTTTVTSSSWANASVIGVTKYTNGGLQFRGVTADNDLDITVYHPQLNLGSTLFPYSTPAGAPGTLQTATDYSGMGNHATYGSTAGTDPNDPSNTGLAFAYDGVDDDFTGTPSGTVYSYVLAGDAYGIGAGWVRGKRVNVAGRVYLALFYNRRLTEAEYARLWLVGRQYLARRGFAGAVYNEAWPIPCTAGVMDFGLSNSPGHLWVFPNGTTSTAGKPSPTLASAGTTWLYCVDWRAANMQVNDNTTDSRYVGDLRDLPRVTYALDLGNCPNVTGTLADLPRVTYALGLTICSNVTGTLADLPRVTYYLRISNCSNVTGTLADLPRVTYYLSISNCSNVTGTLADLPRVTHYLDLGNCSNVTGTLDGTWCPTTINLKGIGWSTAECDQTLINFANGTLTGKNLTISAGKRSSASDAAVATLISRGWTVTES